MYLQQGKAGVGNRSCSAAKVEPEPTYGDPTRFVLSAESEDDSGGTCLIPYPARLGRASLLY